MKPSRAIIFDFDNTVANMPTKIYVINTLTKKRIGLSTSNFAKQKNNIGKKGFFKNCAIDENTFEEFRPSEEQHFCNHMKQMLRKRTDTWKASYFDTFIQMLSKKDTSENVYVLTARSHSPEEFLSGLEILKAYLESTQNISIFLPKKENLFFVGKEIDIALAKSLVIKEIVKKEISENTTEIEFADDDHENVIKAQSLMKELKAEFKDVKFLVSFVKEDMVEQTEIAS